MSRSLDANQLRWLGEEADGRRGEPYGLVWDNDKLVFVKQSDIRYRDAVLTVETPFDGVGMQAPDARATVKLANEEIDPNAKGSDPVDAIFLTQSAVEKFVIPYYTRMVGLDTIRALRASLFDNPKVVAAAHVRPSITGGVERTKVIPIGVRADGKLELLEAIELF